MVPKIVHFTWFSGERKPPLVERCLASWRKFCPAWEIREWTLDDIPEPPPFFLAAIKARKWAFASDWARFWIVAQNGGVYLDCDVELIAPIDDLILEGGFFALSSDDPPWVDPGLGFAAEKDDPVIRKIVEKYEAMTFDAACHLSQTCPQVTMSVLKSFPNCRFLPARYFNPKGGCAGEVRLTPDTRAIHHFAASWFNWKQRLAYIWWPRIKRWVGGR